MWLEMTSSLPEGTEKVQFPSIPLISVPSGRFPRARLQPPRHCVPAGSSARAVPAGVAALHYNQLVLTIKKNYFSGLLSAPVFLESGERTATIRLTKKLRRGATKSHPYTFEHPVNCLEVIKSKAIKNAAITSSAQ